jgi:hypothetical protein
MILDNNKKNNKFYSFAHNNSISNNQNISNTSYTTSSGLN